MKTLTVATTNPAKIDQIVDALRPLGIEVVGPDKDDTLPLVEEDGKTPMENAIKKALAYAKDMGRVVFSMDNALYIDGLGASEQPGLHVRRINGKDSSTDDELLGHYSEILERMGGSTTGYWEYGVCIATPDGDIFKTTIKSKRNFVSPPSPKVISGYPLESIQIDPDTGKYISEMNEEEAALFWQKSIGGQLMEFVKNTKLYSV